jgi:hypothetical protein
VFDAAGDAAAALDDAGAEGAAPEARRAGVVFELMLRALPAGWVTEIVALPPAAEAALLAGDPLVWELPPVGTAAGVLLPVDVLNPALVKAVTASPAER